MQKVNGLTLQVRKILQEIFHVRKMHFLMLASLVLMVACKKELEAPDAAPLDPGVLSASKDAVVINSANPGDEAVTLSWTAERNSLITYSLVLSAGNVSDTVATAAGAVSKSFTNGELNTILVNKLGLAIGMAADINAVIIATIPINGKSANTNAVKL
jgi:hypothetical protein